MGKIGAKPKSRANARAGRKSAGENDGNANVLAEVREIIREMQQVEPDVTAGWCANLDSIASGIAGAGVAEWLGGDAHAAHATLLSVVVDMGSRAPDGRNALWRNWTRTFAIRAVVGTLLPEFIRIHKGCLEGTHNKGYNRASHTGG